MIRKIVLFFIFTAMVLILNAACGQGNEKEDEKTEAVTANIQVTFVELGSVRCIPCKKMKPIMDEIEKEYKDRVKVVFHDVWTADGKPFAEKYKIRLIPTQIFLDSEGQEYFRHEGFFPKEEIVRILKLKGVE